MRLKVLFLAMGFALAIAAPLRAANNDLAAGYPVTERTKIKIDDNWRFKLGGADEKNYVVSLDDSKWERVTIPHTLKLTTIDLDGLRESKDQPTFHREVGWYRRDIYPSKGNRRVVLEFEGVHQISTLWVNGKQVGTHSVGGYTPFEFDITDYVKRGAKNCVTILADNRISEVAPPDPGMFDYIKFSGLYRDVYLTETPQMHITSNLESMNSGITITTPSVDWVNLNATIDIRTEVRNESKQSQTATIIQRVVDAEGRVVLKLEQQATIPAGGSHRFIQTGGIEDDVKLWSVESPYLYKVNTLLIDGSGRSIDTKDNRLGLREIVYSHDNGFVINGKVTEIIGMNRHQHYPYIGDALPNSLHYRDVAQLKNLGFNCIRTAHYPQDDELIKACDELGMLVYEEAPTWVRISTQKEWYKNFEAAARAMVRNHKNSPSIYIWGAGINHRGPVPEAQFAIKQEDPTRLTASQGSRWSGWQHSGWTDIFANMNYGPGIWDREEPLFAMEGHSGPETVAEYKRDAMKPGIISWTAHAYYTFHDIGNWENRMRSGAMDGFRYPHKENLLWYPSEMSSKPYIYVPTMWSRELTESQGELVVYSNAERLELLQNGERCGVYYPSKRHVYNSLIAPPYEISGLEYLSNELQIVGYRAGVEIINTKIFTPESASQLHLWADTCGVELKSDGNDIVVLHAEVLDRNGMRLKDYNGEIKFTVESGDASIVGYEESNGIDVRSNPVPTNFGKGSILLRAGSTAGKITVSAQCKGLKSATIALESVAVNSDMVVADSYIIRDRETMLIDMGAKGELLQFGWTPWESDAQDSATVTVMQNRLTDLVAGDTPPASESASVVAPHTQGAYTFTVEPKSKDGVLRWLGEMNVIGKSGFVYGDGVLCTDKGGLVLSISGLPIGRYTLKGYHHAPSSNTDSMDPNLERLKKESVHKLPYAKSLNVSVDGKRMLRALPVTSGKERQYIEPATSVVSFAVTNDSKGCVEINYSSADKLNGVWFNGFELVREL